MTRLALYPYTVSVVFWNIDGRSLRLYRYLFYGGGVHHLAIQALGVVCIAGWVIVTMSIVFIVLKKTIGLRVSKEEELEGLDSTEHGLESAYPDFVTRELH